MSEKNVIVIEVYRSRQETEVALERLLGVPKLSKKCINIFSRSDGRRIVLNKTEKEILYFVSMVGYSSLVEKWWKNDRDKNIEKKIYNLIKIFNNKGIDDSIEYATREQLAQPDNVPSEVDLKTGHKRSVFDGGTGSEMYHERTG